MITKDEIETIETKFRQRIETCRTQGDSLLDLSELELNQLSGNHLVELMREIPKNVTTLDLRSNHFDNLVANGLGFALQGIPKNITTLNLSGNYLYVLRADGLATTLRGIPENVTTLNLSGNCLYVLRADGLATTLQGIPESVTSLDLSANFLHKLGADGLTTALQGIPKHVTTLDLSDNRLNKLDLPALAKALATIPAHVTLVHLRDNGLFTDKTTKEIDAFLQLLGENRHRFNLSGNGESQLARALAPMALLMQEKSTNNPDLPPLNTNVIYHILSFLEPELNPQNQIGFFQQKLGKTIEAITIIDNKNIGALIDLCGDYMAHLERTQSSQHPEKLRVMQELEAILQDNKKKPNQRLSDFAECFSEKKSTLQEHRDSISTRFIASILHVLSLGLYSKFTKGTFAFWRSHGDIVCDKIEKVLPSLISQSPRSTS